MVQLCTYLMIKSCWLKKKASSLAKLDSAFKLQHLISMFTQVSVVCGILWFVFILWFNVLVVKGVFFYSVWLTHPELTENQQSDVVIIIHVLIKFYI